MESEKDSQSSFEDIEHNRRGFLRLGACAGIGFALGQAGLSCCPRCTVQENGALAADEFAMIAYCCLECDKCDVYIATKNNDDELRAKVAKQWKMDEEKLYCDGCKSENALFNCDVKKCAVARGLPTCAHCDDFPSCDKDIWTKSPEIKKKTEEMRRKIRS